MKYLLRSLTLIVLALILAGCAGGTTPTQTRKASPAPTPTPGIPSGTILYQADWSHGLAALGNPSGWKVIGDMLQSDLSENNALKLPAISDPHYAVEVRFQVANVPQDGGFFVVNADRTQGKDGYNAGILDLHSPAPHNQFSNAQVQVFLNPTDDMAQPMVTSDYDPGSIWHTYRIEVEGSSVRFLVNGIGKSSAISSQDHPLSEGPFEVESSQAVINISSITITAL